MWWSGIVAVSVVLIALAVASYFFYCHMTALQDKGTGVLMRVRPAEGENTVGGMGFSSMKRIEYVFTSF